MSAGGARTRARPAGFPAGAKAGHAGHDSIVAIREIRMCFSVIHSPPMAAARTTRAGRVAARARARGVALTGYNLGIRLNISAALRTR